MLSTIVHNAFMLFVPEVLAFLAFPLWSVVYSVVAAWERPYIIHPVSGEGYSPKTPKCLPIFPTPGKSATRRSTSRSQKFACGPATPPDDGGQLRGGGRDPAPAEVTYSRTLRIVSPSKRSLYDGGYTTT